VFSTAKVSDIQFSQIQKVGTSPLFLDTGKIEILLARKICRQLDISVPKTGA
jgi:hypothetical protein